MRLAERYKVAVELASNLPDVGPELLPDVLA
jgi:hypothetical protein